MFPLKLFVITGDEYRIMHQSVASIELFWHNSSANNANVTNLVTLALTLTSG